MVLLSLARLRFPTPHFSIETALQANHLSHFLLCSLLLPLLKAAPRARVICVSSLLHKYATSPPFDDMNHDKSYRGFEVYGETKLANVLFANELGRRLEVRACRLAAFAHECLHVWIRHSL
jgi:NAD(P)-dependent dehydrogenase (short-subunit alcohol dehydrogenase family)